MEIIIHFRGVSRVYARNVTRAQWASFALRLPPGISTTCLEAKRNNTVTYQLRDGAKIVETVHIFRP